MIRIYGYPFTRSTRACWALEEAGAEYEFIPVNLSKGEHRKPEFLKINPGGKLPALIDGDLVLTESAAICTYIGERFPTSGLVPPPNQTTDRAHYFQWCFFAMSELETPLWTLNKYTRLFPEELRVPAVSGTCIWEFQRASAVLAQHMDGREYAVGDSFTAADILLGGTMNWARNAAAHIPAISIEFPVLEAYAERLANRPALVRARSMEAKAAG